MSSCKIYDYTYFSTSDKKILLLVVIIKLGYALICKSLFVISIRKIMDFILTTILQSVVE
jgi:hypothetical protein